MIRDLIWSTLTVEALLVCRASVVMGAPIHGTVEPGFKGVADSFVRGLEKAELGAAVSAYIDGRKVVELWGGWADAQRTREWQHDTSPARTRRRRG